ncbi:MAG: hypothetical protein ABIH11_00965 [Candidatus Altiarchaeota archaeon]
MAGEDLEKQLKEERRRYEELERKYVREHAMLLKREQELDAWYQRSLTGAHPDQLYAIAVAEKMDVLTYHLMRSNETIRQLREEVRNKDSEWASKLAGRESDVKRLEDDVKRITDELEYASKARPTEPERPVSQRIVTPLTEDSFDDLIASPEKREKSQAKSSGPKELAKTVARLKRVKLIDAAILLDSDKNTVMEWAESLESKKLIEVKTDRKDKILVSTNRLLLAYSKHKKK